ARGADPGLAGATAALKAQLAGLAAANVLEAQHEARRLAGQIAVTLAAAPTSRCSPRSPRQWNSACSATPMTAETVQLAPAPPPRALLAPAPPPRALLAPAPPPRPKLAPAPPPRPSVPRPGSS